MGLSVQGRFAAATQDARARIGDPVGAARKEALKLQARVRLGEDPVATIREAKATAAHTFKAAVRDFLEWQKTRRRQDGSIGLRPKSQSEIERHLLVHARPLHNLQLAKVTRKNIADCVTTLHRKNGPRVGNSVRASISALYTWAIKNAKAESNPVVGSPLEGQSSRDRVLLPGELRAIWAALESNQFGDIVKLLALTGQREGEIGGLCWTEIHDGMIILPGARTKNRKPHVVPLSPAARAIIEKQPRRVTAAGTLRDHIFGLGEGGFSGWSRSKLRLNTKIAETLGAPLPHWTLHDLRRTAASYLGGGLPAHLLARLSPSERKLAEGLKVQPHIVEEILNHQSGYKSGIVAVYQRGAYEGEKRTALERWAAHLTAIVEDCESNVAPLRRSDSEHRQVSGRLFGRAQGVADPSQHI
jgi:integrase